MDFEFYLNMEYKKITQKLSDGLCTKIVNKAIRHFRSIKDCLAEEDSGLINVWEEICVEEQTEWSVFHDAYLATIELYFSKEIIPTLTEEEKLLIWLQTDDYNNWETETEKKYDEDKRIIIKFPECICEEMIVLYFVQQLLYAASNYTNVRIEKYMDH